MSINEKGVFSAGAARADITPPVGTCLYGYAPDWHSDSVHDPLDATAFAVSQGGETALLITVTVGDLQTELSDEIRAEVSAKTGVPAKNILIAATHTHSAPNVSGAEGWGDVDRPYVDSIFLPGIVKASAQAVEALKPAEIAYSTVKSEVGVNRRQQMPDGSINFGQNPWGSYDPDMTFIAVRNEQTKEGIINIIHYGCHGTAGGHNREISRDWSGGMCDRIEKLTGTITAYFNGTVGDTGPRLTNGSTVGDCTYIEELGSVAAFDAVRAMKSLGQYREGKLEIFSDTVRLPYKPMPPLDEIRKGLEEYKETENLTNIFALKYKHLKDVEAFLTQGGEMPQAKEIPTTFVSIGEALFVPVPFEVFSGISLRLREYLRKKYPHTLVLSNANGYNFYLPTQDQLCLGGYEVDCFLNGSLFLLEDATDQNLINEILRIVNG
ncbi:MAG: neutral/alkaline non-lysosomal ceramidase N-terminal domain-containing protein [Clostridia bacterium]|nr:neutral/alkaline non-lysosomal ceramidase N-terminal domain-containing protein [Clostridia bacterium]